MSFHLVFLLSALLSFGVGLCAVRGGVGDQPDHRSSHDQVTPTSGGLAILAALGLTLYLTSDAFRFVDGGLTFPAVLGLIGLVGCLGLLDDVFVLPTRLKFTALIALSVLAVWIIGPVTFLPVRAGGIELPVVLGGLGSVLWIFVVTNGVNFMDGSNGILISVMSITSLFLAYLGFDQGAFGVGLLGLGLCAGLIGLAPLNLRRNARIFTGDVGSLTVGFAFACGWLMLLSEPGKSGWLYAGPVIILVFLTDVLLTMLRRARNKENLLSPHRSHLYQRLIQAGWPHVRVALVYGLITLFSAIGAVRYMRPDSDAPLMFFLSAIALMSAVYIGISRRLS